MSSAENVGSIDRLADGKPLHRSVPWDGPGFQVDDQWLRSPPDWLALHPGLGWRFGLAALLIGLLASGAVLRCFEYDESYTHALTAGFFPLNWPRAPFLAGEAQGWFAAGQGNPWQILTDLVQHDTHPPLYFWLMLPWRALFGAEALTMRLPSALLTLGSALVLWRLALVAKAPPLPTVAYGMLAYAVLYVGVIARGYALSLLLVLIGALLLATLLREGKARNRLRQWNRRNVTARAAAAGLAFGLAIFCHYLAALTSAFLLAGFGLTMLAWRQPLPVLAAGLGLALPFFGSVLIRQGQGSAQWHLAGFDWTEAFVRVGMGQAAALFGGTPLYAGGVAGTALFALGACALLLLAGTVLWALRTLLSDPVRRVMVMAAVGGPVALLTLGFFTDRSPFEFRYFVFGVPFVALCLAASLQELWMKSPRIVASVAAALLAWQLAGAVAMPIAAETQQDYWVAVREAAPHMEGGGALLVPISYDGIGMNSPFVWEAPPDWTLRMIRPDEPPETVLAQLGDRPRLVLTTLCDGVGREAAEALRPALESGGWRLQSAARFVEVWTR